MANAINGGGCLGTLGIETIARMGAWRLRVGDAAGEEAGETEGVESAGDELGAVTGAVVGVAIGVAAVGAVVGVVWRLLGVTAGEVRRKKDVTVGCFLSWRENEEK
ncbi:hypothetical protein ACFE04_000771 [Oxalis oulophora]